MSGSPTLRTSFPFLRTQTGPQVLHACEYHELGAHASWAHERNTIPSPSGIVVHFLIRSSSRVSPFLPSHFLPRSYKVPVRGHSPTGCTVLSPYPCFCLASSFFIYVHLYDARLRLEWCIYLSLFPPQCEFMSARVLVPWLLYPHQNLVHISSSVSASWINTMAWCLDHRGSRFKPDSASSFLSLQANVFSPLPAGIDSERLRTLCPRGGCRSGPSCSLDPTDTLFLLHYSLSCISLALQTALMPCFMNWFRRTGGGHSVHRQVWRTMAKSTGLWIGLDLAYPLSYAIYWHVQQLSPIHLFPQLRNRHTNTCFTRWLQALNRGMYKGLRPAY